MHNFTDNFEKEDIAQSRLSVYVHELVHRFHYICFVHLALALHFTSYVPFSDKFKKEDLAQAWLLAHIYELVHTLHYICVLHGVKNFYAGGSFCNREFVRKHMVMEFMDRDCQAAVGYYKVRKLVEINKRGNERKE